MTDEHLSRQERRRLEREREKVYLGQPYIKKLADDQERGRIPFEPGAVVIATIIHDDDCPALNNGFCRCSPDIVYKRAEPTP